MSIKNKKIILVTGATGYVGGRLVSTFVFPTMIRNIIRTSNQRDYREKNASI